eukprot:TRINITY_DN11219_c0_g2_i2.p1 TRINITY_DN11219_c0_g2~~TRINITY_DN11219_c0_g2_i2.p1  ORF type:complete len:359 (+),score=117.59 TRINITY_DN11219_c0_g2_i2:60-1079(+)
MCIRDRFATAEFTNKWELVQNDIFNDTNPLLTEMHVVSSVVKVLNSWSAHRCLQEVRELCGGFGYSAYARIGELLNDNNVNMTWEGDNNVLVQQLAKHILDSVRKQMKTGEPPQLSVSFLNVGYSIDDEKFSVDKILDVQALLKILQYRVNKLTKQSLLTLQNNLATSANPWDAWNNTQVFNLRNLGLAYAEAVVAGSCLNKIDQITDQPLKTFITECFRLYCLSCINNDAVTFRAQDYFTDDHLEAVKANIVRICKWMKDESIGFIDHIASPDHILESPFGAESGDIYNEFMERVLLAPAVFDKPTWYKTFLEIIHTTPDVILNKNAQKQEANAFVEL